MIEANPEDHYDKEECDIDRHELSQTSKATKIRDIEERPLQITGVDFYHHTTQIDVKFVLHMQPDRPKTQTQCPFPAT